MSRFFPHTEYTEDQPYSRTILTTHVAARAFTLGSGIGLAIGGTSHLVDLARARSSLPSSSSASLPPTLPIKPTVNGSGTVNPPSTVTHYPLPIRLLRSSGFSSLFTSALLCALILPYQMHGREPIEWQDRAWRLLENKGQMEVDEWTGVGALGGSVAGLVASSRGGLETGAVKLGARGVLGAAGVGSLVGLVGYLGYRYGWKGGKWDEDE